VRVDLRDGGAHEVLVGGKAIDELGALGEQRAVRGAEIGFRGVDVVQGGLAGGQARGEVLEHCQWAFHAGVSCWPIL
jgi:hypothetical protein